MRRCCTFCGAEQWVSDEKITASWFFTRCHACEGLSVIRISDQPPKNLKLPPPMRIDTVPGPNVGPGNVTSPQATIPETSTAQAESGPKIFKKAETKVFKFSLIKSAALVLITFGTYLTLHPHLTKRSAHVSKIQSPVFETIQAANKVATPPLSQPPLPAIQPKSAEPKQVRVVAGSARLRAGPGLDFPIVGVVRADLSLTVTSLKDEWIEVAYSNPSRPVALGNTHPSSQILTAWVRHDLVQEVRSHLNEH